VIDNLNVLDYDYYFKLTQAIQEEDSSRCLLLFDEILLNGFDGSHFIAGLASHFRNLLVAKDIETVKLLEVSKSIKERYLNQAEKVSQSLLLSGLNIANQCEIQYKTSKNKRLQVELALLKMCHISAAIQLSNQPLPATSQTVSDKKKTPDRADVTKTEDPPVVAKEPPAVVAEPAKPKRKLSFPKLGEVSIGSQIPNLDAVFEEKKVDVKKGPVYVMGDAEDAFDETSFLEYWNIFANQIKEENKISLYTLMVANAPVLKENYQVEVIVENPIQQQLLIESKIDMLNFLRQKLNNFKVDLIPILQKVDIVRKPVTDTEKYQAMVTKNPLLDKFRTEFNLGFE